MYSYTWPASLPQKPLATGYSESLGTNMLRTPMDAGPAKLRRRSARPDGMRTSWHMTSAQVDTLHTFIYDTIKVTARFGFPHPRTDAMVEARFVAGQDGKLFDLSRIAPALWVVSFDLEVLP